MKKIIYLPILLASSLHISCSFNIQNFVKNHAIASSLFSLMGVGVNIFYNPNYNAKQNLIISTGFASLPPLLFNSLFYGLRWNKLFDNINADIQNLSQFMNNLQQNLNNVKNQINSLQQAPA